VQRGDDRAGERRFSGTERAAERDDVTLPQRAAEFARERFKCGPIVEDVILCIQNSDRCCCA